MKCSWQTFLSPLKGQRQYQALLGLFQTTRSTGGFDNFIFVVANDRYILPVFISFSCMQRCHSLHLLVCQFKVEYADVFKDMIRILRTRYRDISCLQMPAKDYLCGSLAVCFCYIHDRFIFKQILRMTSSAEGIP